MYSFFYSYYKKNPLGAGLFNKYSPDQAATQTVSFPLLDNNGLFLFDDNGNNLLDNGDL